MFRSFRPRRVWPGFAVLLVLACAAPVQGYYFFDGFSGNGPLTTDDTNAAWTAANFSRGSLAAPSGACTYDETAGFGRLRIYGTNATSGGWFGWGIKRGNYSASATVPFGALIRVGGFASYTSGGNNACGVELSLVKGAAEFGTALLKQVNPATYYGGYAWRDDLAQAPPAVGYVTDQLTSYTVNTASTLGIYHDGTQIHFTKDGVEVSLTNAEGYVGWNSGFYLAICGAVKGNAAGLQTSTWIDYCLIRSSVSSTVTTKAEVYPDKAQMGIAVPFKYTIKPEFDASTDAGVDEVTITLPAGYTSIAVTAVSNDYDNNGTLDNLALNGSPLGQQYGVSYTNQKIIVRLGARVSHAHGERRIVVCFNATTPSSANLYGTDFVGTVEGKWNATPTNNGTCGPARVVSGNATAEHNTDTVAVKVYDSPDVRIALDPYTIGLDAVNTTFNVNVRNDTLVGNYGVTKVRYTIPAGFSVQGVDSLLLTSAEEAVAVSIAGQVVTINYGSAGKNIPAGGGTDVVLFNIVDDKTLAGGPYLFTAEVDDDVYPSGYIAAGVQSGKTNGLLITEVQASASSYIKPNKIFTSVTNTEFSYYVVNNGSGGNNITWAQITVPAGFSVALNQVSSSLLGTANITVSGDKITLDYGTAGKPLTTSAMDIVTIRAGDSIPSNSPTYGRQWTCQVNNGTVFTNAANNAGNAVDAIISPYGSLSGRIYPLDVIASVTIYTNGTDNAAGYATTDGVTGFYQVNGLSPHAGGYDVYAIGPGYSGARYKLAQAVQSNQNTLVENAFMNQNALDSEASASQSRKFIDDPLTRVDFPSGSLARDAYVTVTRLTNLTAAQRADLAANKQIKAPNSTTGAFDAVQITIQDSGATALEDLVLKGEAQLQIHYDQLNIAAKGWAEANLALFFWDGLHWIKVGGEVSTAADLMVGKLRNLKGTYAVFEAAPATGSGAVRDVTVSPNPFTPGGSSWNVATLSFSLDKAYPSVEVKLFNLRGTLVREYTVDGSLANGSVPWDGKDKDGYLVKSGIYIYQITAGGSTYSGRIVMIR